MTKKHCTACTKVRDGNNAEKYRNSWFCACHKKPITAIKVCGKEKLYIRPEYYEVVNG